jgi:hypothetical protein
VRLLNSVLSAFTVLQHACMVLAVNMLLTNAHEKIGLHSVDGRRFIEDKLERLRRRQALQTNRGFAIHVHPQSGVLQPFVSMTITAECFAGE